MRESTRPRTNLPDGSASALRAFATLFALASFALVGCEGSACEGDCVCRGAECACPSSGDCRVDCAGDCDLACTGSGNCDFTCGAGCLATCPGSGECLVDVGVGSRVTCTGSGNCDVACAGDCVVECPGSGDCVMRCAPGAVCTFERCESPMECPDGVSVCGGRCP